MDRCNPIYSWRLASLIVYHQKTTTMKPVIFALLLSCLFIQLNAQSRRVGVNTGNPQATLHVQGASDEDLLIIETEGATRLKTYKNGGTSIGGDAIPPENGLLVKGTLQPDSGIITPEKLIIESEGESITLKAGGSTITLNKNGDIIIDAKGNNITINAGYSIKLAAPNIDLEGNNINLKGTTLNLEGTDIKIKSSGHASVEAVGILNLNGSITKLNNGGMPAARLGSTTSVSTNNGIIVGNTSPTVLIP